jgi:hypothetical protein
VHLSNSLRALSTGVTIREPQPLDAVAQRILQFASTSADLIVQRSGIRFFRSLVMVEVSSYLMPSISCVANDGWIRSDRTPHYEKGRGNP